MSKGVYNLSCSPVIPRKPVWLGSRYGGQGRPGPSSLLIARPPSVTAGSYTLWFLAVCTYSGQRNPDIEQLWLSVWRWHVGSCEWASYLLWWPPRPLLLQCLVLWLRSKGDFWQLPTCDNPPFFHPSRIITWPIFSDKTHRFRMATAEQSPMYSPFFGVMGATSAMVFSGKSDCWWWNWGKKLSWAKFLMCFFS